MRLFLTVLCVSSLLLLCQIVQLQFKRNNIFDRIYAGSIASSKPPRLFLHVGPGKMATTTIQDALREDRDDLPLDNFCSIHPKHILKLTRILNRAEFSLADSENDEDLADELANVGEEMRRCSELGQNVALSSEGLGLVSKEVYGKIFEPMFKNFDLQVVVGYRRFYSWVPSLFFQLDRKWTRDYSEWPKKGSDSVGRTFHSYFASSGFNNVIRKLYTNSYIENWSKILNTTENIAIYNVHEDKNVMKTFYCDVLGAKQMCEKRSDVPPSDKNVGFSTAYDSIAVAAYRRGMVGYGNIIDRREATKRVQNYFASKNMTESDLPKTCFDESELEAILLTTKRTESKFLPDFYAGENGERTMIDEFNKLKESKYCEVDAAKVLEEHDFCWDEIKD